MHPLLLTFRNDALESAFERYTYEQTHRLGDIRFFSVATVVLFSIATKTMVEQEFRLLPALPFFCASALTAVMWRLYHTSSTQSALRLRHYMSIIFRSSHPPCLRKILFKRVCRVAVALAGGVASHYMKWMFAFVPNPIVVTVQFLLATETFGNLRIPKIDRRCL